MATTKITSDNITDGAVTSAKLASGVGGVAGIVSSADATAITIDSSENVGIGTSSPISKCQVSGANNGDVFYITSSNVEDDRGLMFSNSSNGIVWDLNAKGASSAFGQLTFSTNSTERMRIDSSGNVLVKGGQELRLNRSDNATYGSIKYLTGSGGLQLNDQNSDGITFVRGGSSESMRIDSAGDVMIGTTASIAGATLTTVSSGNTHQVMRSSGASAGEYWRQEVDSSNDFYLVDNNTTGVYITDGSTSWSGISDENLKENIVELTGVLDKVKDFRCVEYNLIADEDNSKKIGFIAQDWQEDYSEVVSQDNDGNLGMKYTETIPVLLKAIQEQQTLIESLTTRLETMENA